MVEVGTTPREIDDPFGTPEFEQRRVERETRLELATSSLEVKRTGFELKSALFGL
jgi:hypothetical protein